MAGQAKELVWASARGGGVWSPVCGGMAGFMGTGAAKFLDLTKVSAPAAGEVSARGGVVR